MADVEALSELEPHAPASEPHRLTIRALALSIALLLAVGASSAAFGVGRDAGPAEDQGATVRLAAAGSAATAEDFAMEVTVLNDGKREQFRTEMAIDIETKNMAMAFVFDEVRTEAVVVGGEGFLKLPEQLRGQGTAPWMRMHPSSSSAAEPEPRPTNPLDYFASLGAINGPIERVGTEKVRGEPTTHYRTTIDATLIRKSPSSRVDPESLRNVGYEVWLDDRDRPRRMRETKRTKKPNGDEQETVVVIEAFDYGKPVVVEAPPPDQVREYDAALLGPKPPG